MNTVQLEYFITAAECGSFSRAADRFFISQPAISKQIHLLEEEWGLTLFHRRYRSVSLTEAGELMIEHIKRASRALQSALDHAKQLEQTPGKQFFSIGLFENSDLGNLHKIVKEFSVAQPDVAFSIDKNNFVALNESLSAQSFDLIVTLEHMILDKSIVETRTLLTARYIAFLSKGHRLASKPDLNFSDLCEERFFIPTSKNSHLTYNTCMNICLAQGFTMQNFRMVPNIETAIMAVRMGDGAVILDDQVVIHQTPDLISIPTSLYSPVVMAWLKNSDNPLIPLVVQNILDNYAQG